MGFSQAPALVKDYSAEQFVRDYAPVRRIIMPTGSVAVYSVVLNAGSKGVRYAGTHCINVDLVAGPNVDVVRDLHHLILDHLPYQAPVDAVVCNAVLQYCRYPHHVLVRLRQVLKPTGYLYLETPWVQQYCEDTPDRWRFSEVALRDLVADAGLEVCAIGSTIRPGSAIAWLCWELAAHLTGNRYLDGVARTLVGVLTWPLRFLRGTAPRRSAGGLYVIARCPAEGTHDGR